MYVKGILNQSDKNKLPPEKRKLSFKEARELRELPQKIGFLEEKRQQLTAALNSPACCAKNAAVKIKAASDRMTCLETELDCAQQCWQELEDLAARPGR